jgi:hypothetical protein
MYIGIIGVHFVMLFFFITSKLTTPEQLPLNIALTHSAKKGNRTLSYVCMLHVHLGFPFDII